jgi:hypothetical protein
VARVVVAPAAVADLDELIRVLSLPADTRPQVKGRLRQLPDLPESGE